MGCCGKVFGAFCIFFGAIFVALSGFIGPKEIVPNIVVTMTDEVVIYTQEENDARGIKYEKFTSNGDSNELSFDDSDGIQQYYYIYNVENPAEFLEGRAKPNVSEVGPFGYGSVKRKYDVVFLSEDVVSYKSYKYDFPLSADACENGQTLYGHPSPSKCLDVNTTVTVLNPNWAGLMESVPPAMLTKSFGMPAFGGMLSETKKGLISALKKPTMPMLMTGLYGRYLGQYAVTALSGSVNAAVASSDLASLTSEYNKPTAIANANSPIGIVTAVLGAKSVAATSVFATDAMMLALYSPDNTFSFFHPQGFEVWIQAMTSPDMMAILVGACSADGTTNCEDRITGIFAWLFSPDTGGWITKEATLVGAYSDYALSTTSAYKCDGVNDCSWGIGPFKDSSNDVPISVSTLYHIIFSSDENSLTSLLNANEVNNQTSWDRWELVESYCAMPRSCAEAASVETAFQQVFSVFAAVNELNSTVEAVKADDDKVSLYTAQICAVARMTKFHLQENAIFDALTFPSFIASPEVNKMDAQVTGFTSYDDFMFLQLGNSAFSKHFMQYDSLVLPPETFKPEFHHTLNQTLTVPEVQMLVGIASNPDFIDTLLALSHNSSSESTFKPDDYAPNLSVSFVGTNLEPFNALLIRKNAAGTSTIASAFAEYLSLLGREYVFKKSRLYCNNPNDCDYRKGGMFVTVTADQLLYTGYADPASLFLANALKTDQTATISCRNPKFYYAETGTTSGESESSEMPFLRDAGTCEAVPDPDCTHDGLQVDSQSVDTVTGDSTPLRRFWTLGNTEDEKDAYYNIATSFTTEDGQVPITTIPIIYAINFGLRYANISYQKNRACKTANASDCFTAYNTGSVNRSEIGVVSLFNNKNTSLNWPEEIPITGSVGTQYAPQYIAGIMNETECAARYSMFISEIEGPLYQDFVKQSTVEYTGSESTAIPVCRYAVTPAAYEKSIEALKNPTLMPPTGFFPIAPGADAVKPSFVALSAPSFLLERIMNSTKEGDKFTGITADVEKHGSYAEVEQGFGAVVRAASRLATYIRVSRSSMYPHLEESYYLFPVNYVTMGGAVPVDEGKVLGFSLSLIRQVRTTFSLAGVIAGAVLIILGLCCCRRARKKDKTVNPLAVKPN